MLALPQSLSRLRRSFDPRPLAPRDNALARYEMKYAVDIRLQEPIRQFVTLFCQPDPYGRGTPPEYQVQTLQFDSPWGDLCRAKEDKAINRFKLRARTYGGDKPAPLFLEIKRKLGDVVYKSRALFKPGWTDLEEIIMGDHENPLLRTGDKMNFLEFRRLMTVIGASPVFLLRYNRESYVSENDMYARVTFDRKMIYQPSRQWSLVAPGNDWRTMDSCTATNRPFPVFILELKTTEQMPTWMAELIERFNLIRCDFCKYATASRLESIFRGAQYSDASENTTY